MKQTGETSTFSSRVVAAVARTGPLCAGIDPSGSLLAEWGLADSASGVQTFGLRCVEAFCDTVAVVKPQVAFFERFGSAGMAALEQVLSAARSAGLLVIADAKRADIGNTMEAYASAWLDPASPLAADAMTAVPYLGLGSLQPAIDLAAREGKGVVVVVRSSNPEGRTLQEARTGDGAGPGVEDLLLSEMAALNAQTETSGVLGAVIGATLEPSGFPLPTLGGIILSPGIGAQGGTAEGVRRLFAGCPKGTVLANVSRSVLGAGGDVASLREAARIAQEEMTGALASD